MNYLQDEAERSSDGVQSELAESIQQSDIDFIADDDNDSNAAQAHNEMHGEQGILVQIASKANRQCPKCLNAKSHRAHANWCPKGKWKKNKNKTSKKRQKVAVFEERQWDDEAMDGGDESDAGDAGEDKNDQTEILRQLHPIPRVPLGLHNVCNFVPAFFGFSASPAELELLRTMPWNLDDGKCDLYDFAMDRAKQTECAKKFARPYRAGLGMRKLPADLEPGHEPDATDHCAVVLNAIMATHEQTALDNPRTAEYSKVLVHQYNSDRTAESVLRPGPGAGLEGCHMLTLFKTSVATSDSAISTSTDSDILKVATYLAQMFHGCDIPNNTCYSCSTAFTEFKRIKNGNKLYHENVRYNNAVPQGSMKLEPCEGFRSKTVDAELLAKIAAVRCPPGEECPHGSGPEGLDCASVIPESRSFARAAIGVQGSTSIAPAGGARAAGGSAAHRASAVHGAGGGCADEDMSDAGAGVGADARAPHTHEKGSASQGAESAFCDEVCQDDFKSGLFDITIWTSYMEGVDERGGRSVVKVETLILKMRVPGSDGCILLDKMRQNMAGCVSSLRCILSHMLSCLNYPQTLDMDKIFSSSVGDMNIAAITEPGQIPVALFNVCSKRHIHNVHWQGMRLDVNSGEEMKLYNEQLRHVIRTRQLHMSIIGQGIAVEGTPGFRHTKRQKYRERYGYYPQLFEGWHWVWAPLDEVERKVIGCMQAASDAGNMVLHNEIVAMWNNFAELNIVLQAEAGASSRVFWRERGAIPFKCGAFAVINPWGVQRYDHQSEKRRRENPHKEQSLYGAPITSITKVAPLMDLYVRNKQEMSTNPYLVFWGADSPVLDRKWMRSNEHKMPVIKELVEAMGEVVTDCGPGTVTGATLNIDDVLVFFGGRSHVLRGAMEDVCVRGDLPNLALSTYNLTMHHIRVALNLMENSELKQVSIAAAVVLQDMKQQGNNFAAEWIADGMRFTRFKEMAVEFSGAAEVLNDDNVVGMWRQLHEHAVGHRLTYCNQALLCGIRDACVAHFAFAASKQYLGAIILADAGYGHIMAKQVFGPPLKRQVTWKNPGSGADSVWNYVGQEAHAYGRHMTRREDLQNEFKSKRMLDQTLSKISSFQLTTVLASGLPTYGDGQIDVSNTNYKTDAFKAFGVTEWAKQFGQNTEVFGAIEQGMAESGTGDGVEKRDWISSHNLNERGTRKTGHGLCNVFLTGNREIPMPQSAFARWQLYASGRWDGDNGVFDRECTDQTAIDSHDLAKELFVTDSYKNILDVTCGKEGRKIVKGLIGHYFQVYYTRKPLTMLTNIMQIPPKFGTYNLRVHVSTLESAWLNMTSDLVRSYIADKNDASRFLGGAWLSSCMLSNWLRCITVQCILRNTRLLQKQPDGKTTLPLTRINEEAVRTLLHTPVTITCMLSALHHITSQSSLDVHIMALSCYMLRSMEWYEHCPLQVLAMSTLGHSMDAKQTAQYEAFAKRLLALVSSSTEGGAAPSGNCWLLHHGNMQVPTVKDALEWCEMGSGDPDVKSKIVGACAVRTTASMKKKRTHFVRTLQRFIRYEPPIFATEQSKKRGEHVAMETVEHVIAELWAEQQSQAAHLFRTEKRAQPTRFDPSRIWHTIAMGTGIQRGHENQAGGQDPNFPKFKAQYETSVYFLDTIRRLGAAQAILRDVMSFLGLGRSCTRLQFVQAILRAYVSDKGLRPVWIDNEYWSEPVLQRQTHRDMFKWSCLPAVKDITDPDNSSVSGIEMFLGMSIEWLVVAQAMYCKEWTVASSDGGMPGETDDGDSYMTDGDMSAPGAPHADAHADATRPRAVCHLRNMAHCASDIIMLIIHMHIDIASLPVMMLDSDGMKSMRLYGHNPLMQSVHKNVCIFFDERLHQDTRGSVSRSTNLLCLRVRQCDGKQMNHMSLRFLHKESELNPITNENIDAATHIEDDFGPLVYDSQHVLTYNAVLADDGEQKLALGEFLPTTPESCYHMPTVVGILQAAHKALFSKYGMQHSLLNQLATSFVVYGQSVDVNIVRFMPTHITEAVAYKEIPCLTWKDGYMFVLRQADDRMQVVPVKPTHALWAACPVMAQLQQDLGLPSFRALPLDKAHHTTDGNMFAMDKIGLFMSHGLSVSAGEQDSVKAHLDINSKFLESNMQDKHPASFYPLLQCPQLVWLESSGCYLVGDDDEMYDIVSARDEYEAMMHSSYLHTLTDAALVSCLSRCGVHINADKANNVKAFLCTRHGDDATATVRRDDDLFIWLDQSELPGREQRCQLLFFKGVAHLKFFSDQLLRSGCVYIPDQCHHAQLLRNAQDNRTYDNSFCLYPMLHRAPHNEVCEALFIHMERYEHVGFDTISASIATTQLQEKASARHVFQLQCDVDDIGRAMESGSIPRYSDQLAAAKDKLHTARVQNATKSRQTATLQERARLCVVAHHVTTVVTLPLLRNNKRMAGPRQPGSTTHTIGMIHAHEREGMMQWLLDGRYSVVFMNDTSTDIIHMDFVTASACLVTEGRRLWLGVDAHMYAVMLKQHPKMRLEQKNQRAIARAGGIRYLQAFYVLGDACSIEAFEEQNITLACMCKDIQGNSAPFVYKLPLFARDTCVSYIHQQPPVMGVLQYHLVAHVRI